MSGCAEGARNVASQDGEARPESFGFTLERGNLIVTESNGTLWRYQKVE